MMFSRKVRWPITYRHVAQSRWSCGLLANARKATLKPKYYAYRSILYRWPYHVTITEEKACFFFRIRPSHVSRISSLTEFDWVKHNCGRLRLDLGIISWPYKECDNVTIYKMVQQSNFNLVSKIFEYSICFLKKMVQCRTCLTETLLTTQARQRTARWAGRHRESHH